MEPMKVYSNYIVIQNPIDNTSKFKVYTTDGGNRWVNSNNITFSGGGGSGAVLTFSLYIYSKMLLALLDQSFLNSLNVEALQYPLLKC